MITLSKPLWSFLIKANYMVINTSVRFKHPAKTTPVAPLGLKALSEPCMSEARNQTRALDKSVYPQEPLFVPRFVLILFEYMDATNFIIIIFYQNIYFSYSIYSQHWYEKMNHAAVFRRNNYKLVKQKRNSVEFTHYHTASNDTVIYRKDLYHLKVH